MIGIASRLALRGLARPRPIEFRPISFDHYLTTEKLEPVQRVWVRCPGVVGDGRALNAARTVTEGIVLAIADEVAASRSAVTPYGATGRAGVGDATAITMNKTA